MKQPSPRYGIGEWFGEALTALSPEQRRALSTTAAKDQPCPFRRDGGNCIKSSGVCSLRLYANRNGIAVPAEDRLRVICPHRFEEASTVFKWVSKEMLGVDNPEIVQEVDFLRAEDGDRAVGRIDMVLVRREGARLVDWCAVEIQAVYFSGPNMKSEIEHLASAKGKPPFPAAVRRPDDRSSGPKRLMPQLMIKVPTLRRWGKKVAVVTDRAFYDNLGKMETVDDLSNGDIGWFAVDFSEADEGRRFSLTPGELFVTTLERATEGLTCGVPVSRDEFEGRILKKMR